MDSPKSFSITIMAAGLGTRMNSPLPKILHPFCGVPMIVRILKECIKLNPSKIIVITNIKSHQITQIAISRHLPFANVQYVQQPDPPLGTGHAIQCTLPYYDDDENVMILNGDMPLISAELLQKITGSSSSAAAAAKLLVANLANPSGYGRIIMDSADGDAKKYVCSIREQKDCNDADANIHLVNTGIYFFHSSYLKRFIPQIQNQNNQKEYYFTDLLSTIRKIEAVLVENEYALQIRGVNSKEELDLLEKEYFTSLNR